jgi:hypothetical protein
VTLGTMVHLPSEKSRRGLLVFSGCASAAATSGTTLPLDWERSRPVAPTDYFPADEFDRIIDSTYAYRENRGETGNTNSTRLRTLTLLMRWSGLRIRDSVTVERSRWHADSLLLYQAKTGTSVYAPLPSHLIAALKDVPPGPKPNPRYFFWSGRALLPIGKGAIAVSSNWPTLRNQTALESAAIRICFATRSRWRCCLPRADRKKPRSMTAGAYTPSSPKRPTGHSA